MGKKSTKVSENYILCTLWQSSLVFDNISRGWIYREASETNFRAPSPFKGPARGPSNALDMPWNLTAHCKKHDKVFPKFDRNSKNLHGFTNKELWNWKKNCFKLRIINSRILSTMLDERPNYFYILSIENITKRHHMQRKSKSEQPKKVGKKVQQRYVMQAIDKNIVLFFWFVW